MKKNPLPGGPFETRTHGRRVDSMNQRLRSPRERLLQNYYAMNRRSRRSVKLAVRIQHQLTSGSHSAGGQPNACVNRSYESLASTAFRLPQHPPATRQSKNNPTRQPSRQGTLAVSSQKNTHQDLVERHPMAPDPDQPLAIKR